MGASINSKLNLEGRTVLGPSQANISTTQTCDKQTRWPEASPASNVE